MLCASIMTTWSYDVLGAGRERRLSLSGMGTIENAGMMIMRALTPGSPDAGNAVCHAACPGVPAGRLAADAVGYVRYLAW